MDGVGRATAIEREDLCRTPRWSQEHHLLTNRLQGTDDGTRQGSLTRTGTTAKNHHGIGISIRQETSKRIKSLTLLLGRNKAELL